MVSHNAIAALCSNIAHLARNVKCREKDQSFQIFLKFHHFKIGTKADSKIQRAFKLQSSQVVVYPLIDGPKVTHTKPSAPSVPHSHAGSPMIGFSKES